MLCVLNCRRSCASLRSTGPARSAQQAQQGRSRLQLCGAWCVLCKKEPKGVIDSKHSAAAGARRLQYTAGAHELCRCRVPRVTKHRAGRCSGIKQGPTGQQQLLLYSSGAAAAWLHGS